MAVIWVTPSLLEGQQSSGPKVNIVQTVGCVERRSGDAAEWWLVQAPEPAVIQAGVFNRSEIEAARNTALGSGTFQLIGVADFLDAAGLLASADRRLFTSPEQVNATGELQEGRKVLVKGALIETDAESRINLLGVIGVADTCE
tara:strand:+ start:1116 stop:1547 length:432 start_codon:yes stop_codon:yes gene_type:complete